MENIGLVFFLVLWGIVILRQAMIIRGHFGRDIPGLSDDSVFRGTWLFRPRSGSGNRTLTADIVILSAYVLIEAIIVVYLLTR